MYKFDCLRSLLLAMLVSVSLLYPRSANSQDFAIKTNALYWATATANVAGEITLNDRLSLDLALGYNRLPMSQNRKLWHVAVQPELRYWIAKPLKGHFFTANLLYSHFNAGGVHMPLGIFPDLKKYRYQGDLEAAGVGYGYAFQFGKHWGLELEASVGVMHASYDKYECRECGTKMGSEHKTFFMPTRLAVSVVYRFGDKGAAPEIPSETIEETEIIAVQPVIPVEPIQPAEPAEPEINLAELTITHPIEEYKPYTRDMVLRKQKGMLYVHFEQDSHHIVRGYSGNGAILDRIVDITRETIADSTQDVKIIQIIGLASIEGPISLNETLSEERAQALKQYIQQRVDAPDSLFVLAHGGEAWSELRDMLEDSDFEGRQELIDIIDNEPDLNQREAKIRALNGGETYNYMLEHILGHQRKSGYLRIFVDGKH